MTSFNTGATASSGASATVSQAITIPAGVQAGDVIMVVFAGFRSGTTAETVQASSTGTAPVMIGTTQNVINLSTLSAAVFYVVAGASDAGKVITGSMVSGDTAQWAAALGAWTGASRSNPVDVSGAATAFGVSSSITCPVRTTTVPGDWALQIVGAALGGAVFTGGAGFTQREAISDANSGVTGLIYDSNASFPAGAGIGGATFANAGNNSWWAGFTIGLAPPANLVTGDDDVPWHLRSRV